MVINVNQHRVVDRAGLSNIPVQFEMIFRLTLFRCTANPSEFFLKGLSHSSGIAENILLWVSG